MFAQLSFLEDGMTFSHSARRPGSAADTQPGPNQWIKDHLDSVIDDQLFADRPRATTDAPAQRPGGPRP
ncbi:hypothetical protein [Streptomyces sp. NPDC088348]|uniref:hypothetical protein n=1 Tax=Streptomyces sp. NPDC088348 TaxID=3365853 RepID=UPI003822C191